MSQIQQDYAEVQQFSNNTSILVNFTDNHVILAQRLAEKTGRYTLRLLEDLSTGKNLVNVKKRKVSSLKIVLNPELLEWVEKGTEIYQRGPKTGQYKNPKGPYLVATGQPRDRRVKPETAQAQFKELKNFVGGKFKYKYSGSRLYGYWIFGEVVMRRDYTEKHARKVEVKK